MTTKVAEYYQKRDNKDVRCTLCPHYCYLKEGQYGKCKVRVNIDGELVSMVYGRVEAINFDPIEKKPLYHFYPGSEILSIGTAGCNFNCFFCQNHQLSQRGISLFAKDSGFDKKHLFKMASEREGNIGIAFTYNEPIVFFEYMKSVAKVFKSFDYVTCMISNGYINSPALNELLELIDAFNIDLKAFTKSFYKKYTGGEISPVLKSIESIAQRGNHLELTYLLIPGLNDNIDDFRSMIKWISDHTSVDTPLHISRYFPGYKSNIPPTNPETLEEFYSLAKAKLNYVYIGNYYKNKGNDTLCPKCGEIQIKRNGYDIDVLLEKNGKCSNCGYKMLKNL